MERVFVSSTCYDLLDVRAEVEEHLRQMGLAPILSDSPTSEFERVPDANSIERCLVNLRGCEVVIVIMCRRYGPSLEKAGFGDYSATHLEYLEARKLGKPVYVYVRDRLQAEYSIWKANRGAESTKFTWVKDPKDRRLFEIIEEHAKLANDSRSNWYDTFSNSLLLKQLISRDFRARAGRVELERLIRDNRVPIVDLQVNASFVGRGVGSARGHVQFVFKNLGTTPAYRLTWQIAEGKPEPDLPILAPGQSIPSSIVMDLSSFVQEWSPIMTVVYRSAEGHQIIDRHNVRVQVTGSDWVYGACLASKQYQVAGEDDRPFEIVSTQVNR